MSFERHKPRTIQRHPLEGAIRRAIAEIEANHRPLMSREERMANNDSDEERARALGSAVHTLMASDDR